VDESGVGSLRGWVYETLFELGLTEFQARTVVLLLFRPLVILLCLLITFLVAKSAEAATSRTVRSLHLRSPLLAHSVRAEQRARTLGSTAGSIVKIFVWVIGILTALDVSGVTIGPLVAGAGIAAAALGFGAQSLVRDFLSGFFILVEDQYGIGDVVRMNDGSVSGTIEEVTLRHTRLRSVDGVVHYIPNGEIKLASNASMEWSRALLDVTILPSNDINRALELFSSEIHAVVASDAWSSVVSEAPIIAGVDAQTRDGVVLRAWVRTTPTDQYPLQRELRRAVVQRFRDEGISMPEAASPPT